MSFHGLMNIKAISYFLMNWRMIPTYCFMVLPKKNLAPILEEGFKAFPPLESVSYTKQSSSCLYYVCNRKGLGESENHVVIAVRFNSLASPGIANNTSDIHVYKSELQPEIIGLCVIPYNYKHR